jgi:DHA3 family macrolide efflux protein-like MFS transporter
MMIAVMAIVINFLLTPAFSLLPILVTNHFKGEAFQLAWFNSAHGFGVLLGGLVLSVWGGFRRRMHTSLVGLLGMGVGATLIAIASEQAYYLALVGMFLFSFFNPIANGPLHAAVQAAVSPEMQGRVFTLIGSLAGLMSPVALMIAGPLADYLGVRTWFLFGAAGLLILGGGAFFVPAITHFEDTRRDAPANPAETAPAQTMVAE